MFLIIYNICVSDLDRKMVELALNCTRHCISWHLVPWQQRDVQGALQVPRGHIHSQSKTFCRSASKTQGTANLPDCEEPWPALGTHLTYLILIKSHVVIAHLAARI